jgi:hypothetical protein
MTDFAGLIEDVAKMLLGKPTAMNKTEWRFGSHGSLAVNIGGPKKGTYYDHEQGTGGGVLDLITRERGCSKQDAIDWIKQQFGNVLDDKPQQAQQPRRIVETYPYRDEDGKLLFEVIRYEPKDFRQRQPDGKGGWVWNLSGVRQVPYRLPDLIDDLAHERTIFIVEGEKDVNRLRDMGVPATCNAAGSKKWRDDFASLFKDADVVIMPDNDTVGQEHAELVALSLHGTARRVRVLTLPDLPRKGDASDWIAQGGTVEALYALAECWPTWAPKRLTRLPAVMYGDEDNEPTLSWLVKGILVNSGLSTIFGGPGTSKTFLALDMALHIAHGWKWFGRKVTAGGVVYVTGEGGSGMRLRMKAWRKEKQGLPRVPFTMVPTSVNLFDNHEDVEKLISDVKTHAAAMEAPVRLVVLDTLSRMIGSGDEDKARDINVVVQRAERIQRETGAHVLIVHHSGKDKDRGMRGSNALLGAADAAIEVTRHDTGLCEGKIAKVKDGGDIDPFRYTLSQSVLGVDEEGDNVTSCIVTPAGASEGAPRERPRLSPAQDVAMRALREVVLDNYDDRTSPDSFGQRSDKLGQCEFVPKNVRRVLITEWRDRAYSMGISLSDKEDTRRRVFDRAVERLLSVHFVGIWEDTAWIVRDDA